MPTIYNCLIFTFMYEKCSTDYVHTYRSIHTHVYICRYINIYMYISIHIYAFIYTNYNISYITYINIELCSKNLVIFERFSYYKFTSIINLYFTALSKIKIRKAKIYPIKMVQKIIKNH